MNNVKFNYGYLWIVLSIFLISCNDAENTSNSTDSTDTKSAEVTPATSNIITTLEGIVIVRSKISDFAKWRASYDTRDSMRTANGISNYIIGSGIKDTNMILVALRSMGQGLGV